jgi:hypothetical protein
MDITLTDDTSEKDDTVSSLLLLSSTMEFEGRSNETPELSIAGFDKKPNKFAFSSIVESDERSNEIGFSLDSPEFEVLGDKSSESI